MSRHFQALCREHHQEEAEEEAEEIVLVYDAAAAAAAFGNSIDRELAVKRNNYYTYYGRLPVAAASYNAIEKEDFC